MVKKKREREEAREARINFRKTSFWSPIAGAANDAWFGITFSTRPEFRSATEFFTLGQHHVRVTKKKVTFENETIRSPAAFVPVTNTQIREQSFSTKQFYDIGRKFYYILLYVEIETLL